MEGSTGTLAEFEELEVDGCCRICLQKVPPIQRKHVKAETFVENLLGQLMYKDLLRICTGYVILDEEPQQFCLRCSDELIKAYELRLRCDETQKILQKVVTKQEEEEVNVKIEIVEGVYQKHAEQEMFYESDYGTQEYGDEHIQEEEIEQKPALINFECKVQEPRFKCDFCEVTYRTETSVRKHCNTEHLEMKVHECPHCKKLFFSPTQVEEHVKKCKKRKKTAEEKNSEKYKYVCPFCGKLSRSTHIKFCTFKNLSKDSPDVKETYICDICGATVSSRGSIATHMRVQHLNERIKCKYCDASFRCASVLASHYRKFHTDKHSRLKCKYCDFTSANHSNLHRHELAHSGRKRHKCPICNHEFITKYAWNNHLATHSDARPHACETCGACFKTTKALGSHKKTHADYDYECPVCQKSYLTNQLMRIHVQRNHPDYELPPPGTVFSKSARKKLAEKQIKEMAIKNGIEKQQKWEDLVVENPPPIDQVQYFQPFKLTVERNSSSYRD